MEAGIVSIIFRTLLLKDPGLMLGLMILFLMPLKISMRPKKRCLFLIARSSRSMNGCRLI